MANLISESLSTADKNNIRNNIEAIKLIISFSRNLTPKERHKLFKMGQKSMGFVKGVLTAMKAHPDAVPASFSVSEFEKDMQLYADLFDVLMQLMPLKEGVEDTLLLVGSELAKQARLGYKMLRNAARTNLALDTTVRELGAALKGSPRTSPTVHSLPAKESITLQRIVPKRYFKTLNKAAVTIYGSETATGKGIAVDGNSKVFIPSGWRILTIVNHDATQQSIFSVIQK
jgi:hypothetical protein